MHARLIRLITGLLLGLAAVSAQAYVGPGAGLSVIGSIIAIGAAVVLALVGLLVLPVRMLMKRRRAADEVAVSADQDGDNATRGDA